MKHFTILLPEVNSPVCLFAFSTLLGQRGRTGQRRVKGEEKKRVNNWMMLQSHADTHMLCWAITSSTEERLLYFLLFTGSFFSSRSATLLFKSYSLLAFHILARAGVLHHFGIQILPHQFVQWWKLCCGTTVWRDGIWKNQSTQGEQSCLVWAAVETEAKLVRPSKLNGKWFSLSLD